MRIYIAVFLILILIFGCASVPQNTHKEYDKIPTGIGPEDMVLDTISGSAARLLVSCNDHRMGAKAKSGNIYAVNLNEAKPVGKILPRIGEPDSLRLHPHGIDLVRQGGQAYLYIVSHDDIRDKHYVVKYSVKKEALEYVVSYQNTFMNSPNSVAALRDGGFYISNDQAKRGNRLATFFAAKSGSIAYCDEKGGWAKVADKLAYPNGLHITPKERYLYVSTTRQHQIFKYSIQEDGNILNKTKVTKIMGGDNIRAANEKEILVPAHLRIFKFAGHYKDSTKTSPSVVYSIDKRNSEGKPNVVYANDGTQINAAATALHYKGYYYISQVFQPYIIRVKVTQ